MNLRYANLNMAGKSVMNVDAVSEVTIPSPASTALPYLSS